MHSYISVTLVLLVGIGPAMSGPIAPPTVSSNMPSHMYTTSASTNNGDNNLTAMQLAMSHHVLSMDSGQTLRRRTGNMWLSQTPDNLHLDPWAPLGPDTTVSDLEHRIEDLESLEKLLPKDGPMTNSPLSPESWGEFLINVQKEAENVLGKLLLHTQDPQLMKLKDRIFKLRSSLTKKKQQLTSS
ncbi:hypothetical protein BC835DRAFT_1398355 [Cytidiella melzeri]|nr:hypothetical protein BC835DRAFT_1398355 [Cytidiella melzeri]